MMIALAARGCLRRTHPRGTAFLTMGGLMTVGTAFRHTPTEMA